MLLLGKDRPDLISCPCGCLSDELYHITPPSSPIVPDGLEIYLPSTPSSVDADSKKRRISNSENFDVPWRLRNLVKSIEGMDGDVPKAMEMFTAFTMFGI